MKIDTPNKNFVFPNPYADTILPTGFKMPASFNSHAMCNQINAVLRANGVFPLFNSSTCCGTREFSVKKWRNALLSRQGASDPLRGYVSSPDPLIRVMDLFSVYETAKYQHDQLIVDMAQSIQHYIHAAPGFAGTIAFAARRSRTITTPSTVEECIAGIRTEKVDPSESNYKLCAGWLQLIGFHRVGDIGTNPNTSNMVDLWVLPRGKNYLAKDQPAGVEV